MLTRRRRRGEDAFDEEMLWHHHMHAYPRRGRGEIPPEVLRLGIEFADGSKATNLRGPFAHEPDDDGRGPMLTQRGGHGGEGRWTQEFWVWPLPPPGPLAFVCEWPHHGIDLTRSEIDAQVVLDAAARAQVLWE